MNKVHIVVNFAKFRRCDNCQKGSCETRNMRPMEAAEMVANICSFVHLHRYFPNYRRVKKICDGHECPDFEPNHKDCSGEQVVID